MKQADLDQMRDWDPVNSSLKDKAMIPISVFLDPPMAFWGLVILVGTAVEKIQKLWGKR